MLTSGVALLALVYYKITDAIFLLQMALYFAGAMFFLRCKGEQRARLGLHDHHIFHYFGGLQGADSPTADGWTWMTPTCRSSFPHDPPPPPDHVQSLRAPACTSII